MKIGILGGGQLGRMLVQAASPLDLNVYVMDKSSDYPAPDIWPYFFEGDFSDYNHVLEFGRTVDVITIEIESVNVEALHQLEAEGKVIIPQPSKLELIADKGLQKQFYADQGLPTSPFLLCHSDEIPSLVEQGKITIPFVQKLRKGGYDGRGVMVVRSAEEVSQVLQGDSLIEELVSIQKELAVIVARGMDGEITSFPVVEMAFHPTANLVEFLFAPSRLPLDKQEEATRIAIACAEKMDIHGLLAVEMFEDENGRILINEVAPRPHNSGHHSIEACITSQYEQLCRILANLPQGKTDLIQPAVMINLLGEDGYSGKVKYQGLGEVMKLGGVYPHIYGKKSTKPFRKMGHVTVLDSNLDEAIKKARTVQNTLKVISQ
ncbi:MAG: 5-(carboxyamino)imidazole ribonucleotide synthase [Saprospiraceae bacterium]|nr:5-(carboxyamino)imidazole ribonucleotide synthase [Saprospiraceae bacterium]